MRETPIVKLVLITAAVIGFTAYRLTPVAPAPSFFMSGDLVLGFLGCLIPQRPLFQDGHVPKS